MFDSDIRWTVPESHPVLRLWQDEPQPEPVLPGWDEWNLELPFTARMGVVRSGLVDKSLQAGDLIGPLRGAELFERLRCYLQLADSAGVDPDMFSTESERLEPVSPHVRRMRRQRSALAREAYAVLCEQVLSRTRSDRRLWQSILNDEPTARELVRFFRLGFDDSGAAMLRNLSSRAGTPEHVEAARFAAFDLCWYGIERGGVDEDDATWQLLDKLQPDFIDILCGLGKLDWLFGDERFRLLLRHSWRHLSRIARRPRSRHSVILRRVREAVLMGRPEAIAYMVLEAQRNEDARRERRAFVR